MQLGAEFEKEQIGTLFVWVGLVLGPLGRGGVSEGSAPEFTRGVV